MLHGYLAHLTDPQKVRVYSAGIERHGVNPSAIETMRDDGIDISHHTSNLVEEYQHIAFDAVITVCDHAKEHCPYLPTVGKTYHHSFEDPAKVRGTEAEIKQAFERVRNEIKAFAEQFVQKHLI